MLQASHLASRRDGLRFGDLIMSRMASVASMKGNRQIYEAVPRAGTALRQAYDLFKRNKGLPINWQSDRHNPRVVTALIDFYGLDIRQLQKGGKWQPSIYVLAGEWFGSEYRDYIAERIAAADPD